MPRIDSAAWSLAGLGVAAVALLGWALIPRAEEDGPAPVVATAPAGAESATPAPETRRERSELDPYGELLALRQADRGAFVERVQALLAGGGPAERLAALRAWCEAGLSNPVPALAQVLADSSRSAAVVDYALAQLQPRCRVDPAARAALIGLLQHPPADPGHRKAAFTQLLRWADRDQLPACKPLLHAETDPDVVVTAAKALEKSTTRGARTALEALHWQHPDAAVRRRLRALGISR